MGCLVCGREPTIRAHLIPACFARNIRGATPDIAVTKGASDSFFAVKTGKFDRKILCEPCDGILGSYEKYAYETLTKLRLDTAHLINTHHTAGDFDADKFIRFCAGIAWKYSVTREEYGRLEIGPYNGTLREVAFNASPIPQSLDALLFRLHTGDDDVYFYREPKLDRQLGVNIVRFSVGQFVVFLKLDKRRPDDEKRYHWIRKGGPLQFPVLPHNTFEEGRVYLDFMRGNNRVHSFLHRKRERK